MGILFPDENTKSDFKIRLLLFIHKNSFKVKTYKKEKRTSKRNYTLVG